MPDIVYVHSYLDDFVQERRNSSTLAMELRLTCTRSSIYFVGWKCLAWILHLCLNRHLPDVTPPLNDLWCSIYHFKMNSLLRAMRVSSNHITPNASWYRLVYLLRFSQYIYKQYARAVEITLHIVSQTLENICCSGYHPTLRTGLGIHEVAWNPVLWLLWVANAFRFWYMCRYNFNLGLTIWTKAGLSNCPQLGSVPCRGVNAGLNMAQQSIKSFCCTPARSQSNESRHASRDTGSSNLVDAASDIEDSDDSIHYAQWTAQGPTRKSKSQFGKKTGKESRTKTEGIGEKDQRKICKHCLFPEYDFLHWNIWEM